MAEAGAEAISAQGYRDTVVAASCLGLVWLGDALIYVVLPLYPAVFGVETATIAILLSANRVIRILGYGWVSPLARRFGANTLTAAACAAAAISTLAYGLTTGFVLLFIARLMWGGAYGVINLTNTAYAYGDGQSRRHAHRAQPRGQHDRPGLGARTRRLAGHAGRPADRCSLSTGSSAFSRCRSRCCCRGCVRPSSDAPARAERRWTPSTLNILFFVIALGADGVFTATLSTLLADIIPVTSALIGAGLLLAGQRLVSVILSFASGSVVDRFEAQRMLAPCSIVIAACDGLDRAGPCLLGRGRADDRARDVCDRRSDDRRAAIGGPHRRDRSLLDVVGHRARGRRVPRHSGLQLGRLSAHLCGARGPYTLAATAWFMLAPSSSAASARVTGRLSRSASRSSSSTAARARRKRALDAGDQIGDQALVDRKLAVGEQLHQHGAQQRIVGRRQCRRPESRAAARPDRAARRASSPAQLAP